MGAARNGAGAGLVILSMVNSGAVLENQVRAPAGHSPGSCQLRPVKCRASSWRRGFSLWDANARAVPGGMMLLAGMSLSCLYTPPRADLPMAPTAVVATKPTLELPMQLRTPPPAPVPAIAPEAPGAHASAPADNNIYKPHPRDQWQVPSDEWQAPSDRVDVRPVVVVVGPPGSSGQHGFGNGVVLNELDELVPTQCVVLTCAHVIQSTKNGASDIRVGVFSDSAIDRSAIAVDGRCVEYKEFRARAAYVDYGEDLALLITEEPLRLYGVRVDPTGKFNGSQIWVSIVPYGQPVASGGVHPRFQRGQSGSPAFDPDGLLTAIAQSAWILEDGSIERGFWKYAPDIVSFLHDARNVVRQ